MDALFVSCWLNTWKCRFRKRSASTWTCIAAAQVVMTVEREAEMATLNNSSGSTPLGPVGVHFRDAKGTRLAAI